MAKIKMPSGSVKTKEAKKKRVRLKNAFPPGVHKRRLLAKARKIARKRLCSRKTSQSFREAFGASDDEVSASSPTLAVENVKDSGHMDMDGG